MNGRILIPSVILSEMLQKQTSLAAQDLEEKNKTLSFK